jgi:hypothetical protein
MIERTSMTTALVLPMTTAPPDVIAVHPKVEVPLADRPVDELRQVGRVVERARVLQQALRLRQVVGERQDDSGRWHRSVS